MTCEVAGEKRCQYMPPIGDNGPLNDLRDQILASPKDIEDLVQAGQSAHTCPYFASRAAIPQAEVRSSSAVLRSICLYTGIARDVAL